jgi:MFS family permease
MTIAALMDMLDVTVVNVALPTLRTKLHATSTELEWLIAGYLLAFGATLIVWGRIGDLLGRRRVFLGAVAVFGVASLGAGLSPSIESLICFRLIQGAAAGWYRKCSPRSARVSITPPGSSRSESMALSRAWPRPPASSSAACSPSTTFSAWAGGRSSSSTSRSRWRCCCVPG